MQPNPFQYLTADKHREDLLREAAEFRRTFSEAELARLRRRIVMPAIFLPLCALVQWLAREFEPMPPYVATGPPSVRPLSIHDSR